MVKFNFEFVGGFGTHIFDFLYCEVSIGGDAYCLWPYVHDDHYWSRNIPFEEVIDFLV